MGVAASEAKLRSVNLAALGNLWLQKTFVRLEKNSSKAVVRAKKRNIFEFFEIINIDLEMIDKEAFFEADAAGGVVELGRGSSVGH